MFYVFDPGGVRSEYVPGALREARVRLNREAGRVPRVDSKGPVSPNQQNQSPAGKSKRELPFPGDAYEEVLAERRQQVITVSQIMSRDVQIAHPEDEVAVIWRIFRTHRFRHVPVVENDRVVGLVSDRDVLPRRTDRSGEFVDPDVRSVRHLMSAPVLTVLPDTRIRNVARVMLEAHVGALPVINESNVLIGLVTRTDILRAVVQHAPLELWI